MGEKEKKILEILKKKRVNLMPFNHYKEETYYNRCLASKYQLTHYEFMLIKEWLESER